MSQQHPPTPQALSSSLSSPDSSHHSHEDSHGYAGASHGSIKEYSLGLLLSVVLTVIPFAIVMSGIASVPVSIGIIIVCAIAQLLVQAVFFLHMNTSSEQSWNLLTGLYSVLLVVILILGSMWIFSHLHHNMLMGH